MKKDISGRDRNWDTVAENFFAKRGEDSFRSFVQMCNNPRLDLYDIAKIMGISRVQTCRLRKMLLDAIYLPNRNVVKVLKHMTECAIDDIKRRDAMMKENSEIREELKEWIPPERKAG